MPVVFTAYVIERPRITSQHHVQTYHLPWNRFTIGRSM